MNYKTLIKFILSFSLLVGVTNIFAAKPKDKFVVNLVGKKKDAKYLKRTAELKMARNVQYCRGFFLPKANSSWNCKNKKKDIQCSREYNCKRTHSKFSRYTETLRVKRSLKELYYSGAKYSIWTSDMPINVYDKYRTAVEVNRLIKEKGLPISEISPEVVVVLDDLSELAQIENGKTSEDEVEIITGDPELNMKIEGGY